VDVGAGCEGRLGEGLRWRVRGRRGGGRGEFDAAVPQPEDIPGVAVGGVGWAAGTEEGCQGDGAGFCVFVDCGVGVFGGGERGIVWGGAAVKVRNSGIEKGPRGEREGLKLWAKPDVPVDVVFED
jgi:hypothetical protein